MTVTVQKLRLAINNVNDVPPDERRQRITELLDLAVQLRDRVMLTPSGFDGLPLSWHDWLVREDAWLTANHSDEPAFIDREVTYLKNVVKYQEACDVIAAALDTVREATDGGATPKSKQGVWRQLSEPPF